MRIIAGKWRSRRLPVPEITGVRPTGDRIRETLFNWIGPRIINCKVLDLFAGSGALGFEAASREAPQVLMVDRSAAVVQHLQTCKQLLQADQVQISQTDAMALISGETTAGYDLILLDPPFDSDWLQPAIEALIAGHWVNPAGNIYVESHRKAPRPELPGGWRWIREKTAGDVWFALAAQGAQDN